MGEEGAESSVIGAGAVWIVKRPVLDRAIIQEC